ncbi:winged helix DNA-binding domain-containing protein [Nonomuraea sp. NPDC050691]|uniref:winged helix DNA-binding domain-containing protein n=1 Tax=Nonomuraea sp. NPDC050691 TaxID=3155661 RepID=UPI00340E8E39
MDDTLNGTRVDRRTLNRAALARQSLTERADLPALDMIRHLVGLQAQAADPPYIGLWTRLSGFTHDDLTRLLYDRTVVRSSVLRGTQHIVTAADFPWLRPLMRAPLGRARQAAFGRATAGMDLDELAAAGRDLLRGRTLTRPRLRDLLAERWPDRDPEALAWSVQALVPVVHRPPSGTWGKGGATPFTLAEEWLGVPMAAEPGVDDLALRYLAAFGPAGVRDLQMWSGLRGLEAGLERLRPRLRVYRDESGNELFDLPDAELPDPGTPVPVRFLPAFDNLVVAYADRTRIMTDEHRRRVCVGSMVAPTVLVDGFVRGTWKVTKDRDTAVLAVELFEPVTDRATIEELAEEGERLLDFAAAGLAHDVRITTAR